MGRLAVPRSSHQSFTFQALDLAASFGNVGQVPSDQPLPESLFLRIISHAELPAHLSDTCADQMSFVLKLEAN
jgi:hypothetical protein